jgi:hypothetical protein
MLVFIDGGASPPTPAGGPAPCSASQLPASPAPMAIRDLKRQKRASG